jgi:hypothetical protein
MDDDDVVRMRMMMKMPMTMTVKTTMLMTLDDVRGRKEHRPSISDPGKEDK